MLEAIILAGGLGTRLSPVVTGLPKPMAPIGNRPFLEIVLPSLAVKGFGRVVLSLGYMAENISSHFGDSFAGLELVYVVEEQALGTGGGVRLALTQCKEDHAFVFNGDTFLDLEVDVVEQQWQQEGKSIIIGRQVDDTVRYGRLLTSGGRVVGFTEKGVVGSGVINAGCYVFDRNELDAFPLNIPFSLEVDFLSKSISSKEFQVFISDGKFIDIGIPEDFARAQIELKDI